MQRINCSVKRYLSLSAIAGLFTLVVIVKESNAQVDMFMGLIYSTESVIIKNQSYIWIEYGDPTTFCPAKIFSAPFVSIDYNGCGPACSVPSMGSLSFDYPGNSLYFVYQQKMQIDQIPHVSNLSNIVFNPLGTIGISNQVTGLAVDWISRLLYWSDATEKHIGVIVLPTYDYWQPVINTSLSSPQSVAVYPLLSFLFWIDGGDNPKIERSDLAGNNRTLLVNSAISMLTSPTNLVVDVTQLRLLWLDLASRKIGSVDFQGNNVQFWSDPSWTTLSTFTVYKNILIVGYQNTTNFNNVIIYNITGPVLDGNLCGFYVGNLKGPIDLTVFAPENQPNASTPCSVQNGGCTHICFTQSPTTRTCGCGFGFFMEPDGITCSTQPFQANFLFMTDRYQKNLFQVHLVTGEVRALKNVYSPIYPTAMDYDPASKYVYWVDANQNVIMETSYNATSSTQSPLRYLETVSQITSMSVDGLNEVLYYVDYGLRLIGQLSLSDTSQYTTLILESETSPRVMVLDKANGALFWSSCGSVSSSIKRANITNINSFQSIVSDISTCITALAIDFTGGVIYWGTQEGTIETSYLNGTGRATIYADPLANYTDFAVDTLFLYVADYSQKLLNKLDRSTNIMEALTAYVFTTPSAIALEDIPSAPSTQITAPTTVYPSSGLPVTDVILAAVFGGFGALILLVLVIVFISIAVKKTRKRRAGADSKQGVTGEIAMYSYATVNSQTDSVYDRPESVSGLTRDSEGYNHLKRGEQEHHYSTTAPDILMGQNVEKPDSVYNDSIIRRMSADTLYANFDADIKY